MAEGKATSPLVRRLLLGGFFLLVVPLGVYAAYVNLHLASEVQERVQERLDRYRSDLAAERWAEARGHWTEEGRERHPPDAFARAHVARRSELGTPTDLTVQAVSEVHEPGQPTRYDVRVMWVGERGRRAVTYDVREVDGTLLIDRSYARPSSGSRTPGVY